MYEGGGGGGVYWIGLVTVNVIGPPSLTSTTNVAVLTARDSVDRNTR